MMIVRNPLRLRAAAGLPISIDNGGGRKNCRVVFRPFEGDSRRVVVPVFPKTKNKAQARRLAGKLVEEWYEKHGAQVGLQVAREAVSGDSVEVAVRQHISLVYAECKPSTREKAEELLKKMIRILRTQRGGLPEDWFLKNKNWFEKNASGLRLGDLTRNAFELAIPSLREGLNPKGWANFLSAQRRFFKWCVKRELLLKDPSEDTVFPKKHTFKKRGIENLWSEKRFKDTLVHLDKNARTLLTVMWWTGMDPSDVYTMETRHIRQARDPKFGEYLLIVKQRDKGKTEEEKIELPIPKTIEAVFRKAMEGKGDRERIFGDIIQNQRVTLFTHSFLRKIQRAQRHAGYTDLRVTKEIRHTVESRLAEAGVDFETRNKWLGRHPASTTGRTTYTHLAPKPFMVNRKGKVLRRD